MKKHKILDAIQTEIRRWENQYAIHFERSDIKGLARIKKKLDLLKAEYKKVMDVPCDEYMDIDILYRRKQLRSSISGEEAVKPGFDTMRVHRVFEKQSPQSHKAGADTFFTNLLSFCCPRCSSGLWLIAEETQIPLYECLMGHRYNKQELIIWYSEKIIDAIENSIENIPNISGAETGSPVRANSEVSRHADLVRKAVDELKRKSA